MVYQCALLLLPALSMMSDIRQLYNCLSSFKWESHEIVCMLQYLLKVKSSLSIWYNYQIEDKLKLPCKSVVLLNHIVISQHMMGF